MSLVLDLGQGVHVYPVTSLSLHCAGSGASQWVPIYPLCAPALTKPSSLWLRIFYSLKVFHQVASL